MSEGLDVIIVDDDPIVCELIETIVKRFYTWGEVIAFNNTDEAMAYCNGRDIGVAIFILAKYGAAKRVVCWICGSCWCIV